MQYKKIGVIDSGGMFTHHFFRNKKLTVLGFKKAQVWKETSELTHGEYVCSIIWKENPDAEIVLVPCINENLKCSVQDLIDSIKLLMEQGVVIMNVSLGDEYHYHKELETVCREAYEKGIQIIAAHSNRKAAATYPADFPFVIGIDSFAEKNTDQIMQYKQEKNDVFFSSPYLSIYHMGIPGMIPGNSFGCAKLTGMISQRKETDNFGIKSLTESIFNSYYPHAGLKKKSCLFLTNRISDLMQQKFIEEITNSIRCLSLQELDFSSLCRENNNFDVLLIDHNCYNDALRYKEDIVRYAQRNRKTEVVLRYPLFSYSERIELLEKNNIVLNQFYI